MQLKTVETHRVKDTNGWVEIKGNPLSKEGVFDYLGSQISDALIPDKVYKVYRPAAELSDQECIDSFKLIPWTDEHAMLGGGYTDPAYKGIEGIIGENVYFEDGYLKGNLKVFTQKLADLIGRGKKELSIGYKCIYDIVKGTFNGQAYDVVQRCIRGNHVALVSEGRSGKDVAVLDQQFKFTLDTKELTMEEEVIKEVVSEEEGVMQDMEKKVSLVMLSETIAQLSSAVQAIQEQLKSATEASEEVTDEDEIEIEIEKEDEEEKDAMDSKINKMKSDFEAYKKDGIKSLLTEISKSKTLADKISKFVGTFDHSSMTLKDVAQYGVKKLALDCANGHEISALNAYFKAKELPQSSYVALDSATKGSKIADFLRGAN